MANHLLNEKIDSLRNIIRKGVSLLISCLIFSAWASAQSTDSLTIQLTRKWENAKLYTLKIADLMPADHFNFRPVADVMSFKEQLVHTADNMKWLSAAFLSAAGDKQVKDTAPLDKATVIQYIAQAYEQAFAAHKNLHPDQLNEVVPFFAGPMTKRQILLLLHDHPAHHIGQLIVYLRLKGIKPPAYVGW